MAIAITNPTTVTQIPKEVKLGKCQFDFKTNEAMIMWELLSTTEQVLDSGMVFISDAKTVITYLMSKQPQKVTETPNAFTDFYNTGYKDHEDLEQKVSILVGYAGTFKSEGLI